MVLARILLVLQGLEDPKNPLLGPTLKGLYLFGLWQTGSKFRIGVYNAIHFSTFLFLVSQLFDLYIVWGDINKLLNNMSLTVLSIVCVAKCCSFVFWQKRWRELVAEISGEEILQIVKNDAVVMKHIRNYTKYTRIITYLYWILVFATNALLIVTPFLKYYSSSDYHEEIKVGNEPLPQIMCSWFPFDTTMMPGYLGAVIVHIIMGSQGSGIIAVFDMNALAIMSYLKGQLAILKEKCEGLFEDVTTAEEVLDRIRECHRHHNVLVNHFKMFNSLLSPTMFLYVLLCSITICCSVVQFSSKDVTTSQKLWVVEYTSGLVSQLFLYCWHGNEVTIESTEVDRGVYKSEWWRADVRVRRQLLLLSGKLTRPFVLNAGPYTALSVAAFIDITKRSYSYYTLFSQMQHDK